MRIRIKVAAFFRAKLDKNPFVEYFKKNKNIFFTNILIHQTMQIVTTPDVPGRETAEAIGVVRGSTVRARNIGRDIFAAFKNLIGGEISEYTRLLTDSREQALKRMTDEAGVLGADAVVNLRFTTSTVMQGCSEILAYGTAVKLR